MNILFRSLLFLLAGVPLWANAIEATFVGVNGAIAYGYYVGPYYGRLDQQSVVLDCVDFANEVSIGQHWAANLSHVNTQADLANTRFGSGANALQLYQEAAWLTVQYSLNPSFDYADIQATIWQLFDSYAPSPATGYWLSQAEANYAAGNYNNFFVVTNVGPVNPTGQVQEFLTVLQPGMSIYPQDSAQNIAGTYSVLTPEPGLMGVLGLALISLGFARKKLRTRRFNRDL
jgi:hypothetical protein